MICLYNLKHEEEILAYLNEAIKISRKFYDQETHTYEEWKDLAWSLEYPISMLEFELDREECSFSEITMYIQYLRMREDYVGVFYGVMFLKKILFIEEEDEE